MPFWALPFDELQSMTLGGLQPNHEAAIREQPQISRDIHVYQMILYMKCVLIAGFQIRDREDIQSVQYGLRREMDRLDDEINRST